MMNYETNRGGIEQVKSTLQFWPDLSTAFSRTLIRTLTREFVGGSIPAGR